jgi:hypothetical protein
MAKSKESSNKPSFGKVKKGKPYKSANKHDRKTKPYRGQGRG